MTTEVYTHDIPGIHLRIRKQTHDFVTEEIDLSVRGLSLDDCETKIKSLLKRVKEDK